MKTRRVKDRAFDQTGRGLGIKEFNMSLPMSVSGLDAQGQEFKESAILSTISSEEASFLLKTRVERQSLLKLVIPLPPKLNDGQSLSLVLKGKVLAVEAVSGNEPTQKILVQLDSRYFIGSDEA